MIKRYGVPIFVALSLLSIVAFISLEQLWVIIYKMEMLINGGLVGLFMDIISTPYAQPSSYLINHWSWNQWANNEATFKVAEGYERIFIAALAKRAVMVVGFAWAMGVGL